MKINYDLGNICPIINEAGVVTFITDVIETNLLFPAYINTGIKICYGFHTGI